MNSDNDSSLDSDLGELLENIFSCGHYCCEQEYCEAYIDVSEEIEKIKETFKKSGWKPEETK